MRSEGVSLGKKNFEKAEQFYKRAIELDDSNMAPYYNLASTYTELGNFQEALSYLDLAIQKGMKQYDYIQKDEVLTPLMELPEYKVLMKSIFRIKSRTKNSKREFCLRKFKRLFG
ncbi:MAG: tetratricopeptide repeat protein [Saprospiraceae bacterium]|nr:tetratricopeptide repeat protein [Saprospiraceae bacterium]